MTDLLLLFLICLIGAEAWLRRQQSELAERLIRHDLQLLSVARQSFGIPLFLARITQKANAFVFEFSRDGVSTEEGELYLVGLHQPVFRVNPPKQSTSHSNETGGIVVNMPAHDENHDSPPVKSDKNNVIPFPRQRH